jgi:hypothetical protein
MTVPVFVQAGAGFEGTAGTVVSITGCTAGNMLILGVYKKGTTGFTFIDTAVNCTDISGAASLGHPQTPTVGSPKVGDLDFYVGKVTANGTCSITTRLTAGTDPQYARFFEISDWLSTATIWQNALEDALGTELGTSTTVTDEQIISTGSDRLAGSLCAIDGAVTTTAFTGQTGGTWVEPVASYSGTAATIQLQTADLPNAATINGGTFTISPSTGWGLSGFAIIGEVSSPPGLGDNPPIGLLGRGAGW